MAGKHYCVGCKMNSGGSRAPKEPKEAASAKDVLTVVFSNLTIAGAVVYASGWVYLRSYYDFFDIDLSILEFGWNDTLIYSISVLAFVARRLWSWWSVLVLGIVGVVILVILRRPNLRNAVETVWHSFAWRSTMMIVLTAALSAYVFVMAQRAGRQNAINAWKAPRLATTIVFAKDCEPSVLLRKDNEMGELLMLKATPKLNILFSRNTDSRSDPMDMRLYRVPASCVSHMMTEIRRPTR